MDKDSRAEKVYHNIPAIQGKTRDGHEFVLGERNGRIVVFVHGNVYEYEVVEVYEQGKQRESDDIQYDDWRCGMEPWELDAEEDYPD